MAYGEPAAIAPYLDPIRISVVLDCPLHEAFLAFTDDISRWWPLATHSVAGARAARCHFEPGVGGRLVETAVDGSETVWAEVAAWDPPGLIVLRWHPGLPSAQAQTVEIRFSAEGLRSRVHLEHRDWQQTRESQAQRARYQPGWTGLLERQFNAWVRANTRKETP